ncbi:MAG: 1,4-dihydroxy-6-naphthoate synthase [Bacteroidales bacterium]|nr:1,4-dihydroxy-6-naphthoate synthase [Bacteroidales bacterium]
MKLSLGFSPCPNDTFIFGAMALGKVDTEGLEFDYFLADVEQLNCKAFEGKTDILKLSYHAYTYVAENYLILDAGSAIGRGNGPLLISKKEIKMDEMPLLTIAIPGKYTTANLLFSIYCPEALNKKVYLFSEIPDVLLKEEADAGIIIHETRFTYHEKGLKKITDLGEFWEKLTGLPVPLGAITVNRSLSEDISQKVNRIIKRSIEYAYKNPDFSFNFVRQYAKETDPDVIRSHIKLYVNKYTYSMGREGREAVEKFFSTAMNAGVIPDLPERVFL